MRLHEYEGTDIFETYGIPVPLRMITQTPEQTSAAAEDIGFPVVLKSQVLVGGRGLAGGILTASDADDAAQKSAELFNKEIKGLPVEELMVVKQAAVERELYMGITIDGFNGHPVAVVSTQGGVLIEETAKNAPEQIASAAIDPNFGFYPYQANALLKKLDLAPATAMKCAAILTKLYKIFETYEAVIAEINPLAVLDDGSLMALDSVIEIDDSAMFRVKKSLNTKEINRQSNELEQRGKQIGVTYVDLDGDIGLISSGAGLGMASMDIIGSKLSPANFLETGGGITAELLYKCMDLIMQKELKAIFINIYGGINPIHEGAKGVVKYIKENNVTIPIVAKALGNHQEETWDILASGGVHVVTRTDTETAVDKLIELLDK